MSSNLLCVSCLGTSSAGWLQGQTAIVELLISAGCDQEVRDEHNRTGREMAEFRRHPGVVALIDKLAALAEGEPTEEELAT